MNRYLVRSLLVAALVLAAAVASATTPVGTMFTYQGALQDGGAPANGTYDFQFRLFDDPTAGSQVGPTVPVDNLPVTVGVFTAQIDFGAGAFGPNARWLEIGVRPGSGGPGDPYTILTPRQPLTAAPVSLFTLNSGDNHWNQVGNAITNNNSGFVGVGRSTQVTGAEYFGLEAPVTTGYGGMYIRTDGAGGWPFYGYSNGTISAWTYLDGSTGNWHLNNGGNRLTVTGAGNVGIGQDLPASKLEVDATATDAVTGTSSAAFSNGVHGSGLATGVRGDCGTSDGAGVMGVDDTNGGTGVWGATAGNGAGVAGYANFGTGVYGQTSNGYGVYGSNGGSDQTGYAAYFNGRVHVAGNLSKASGSFKIDHPLDPLNKYLSHSFVESPDMMNIYNGNVTTDSDGRATIPLPSYFQALNQDFRYQLTVIGAFAQAMVDQEIKNNSFSIRTDKPNVRVSWQVTGIRHDAWAETHRVVVEEDKPLAERGKYLNPGAYPMAANTNSTPSTTRTAKGGVR